MNTFDLLALIIAIIAWIALVMIELRQGENPFRLWEYEEDNSHEIN